MVENKIKTIKFYTKTQKTLEFYKAALQNRIKRENMITHSLKIYLPLTMVILLHGCAQTSNVPLLEEKSKEIDRISIASAQTLKVGDSTTEIIKILGTPNIITKNKDGNESWVYDRVSDQYEFVQSDSKGSYVFSNPTRTIKSASAKKTFIVVIDFDKNSLISAISYRFTQF